MSDQNTESMNTDKDLLIDFFYYTAPKKRKTRREHYAISKNGNRHVIEKIGRGDCPWEAVIAPGTTAEFPTLREAKWYIRDVNTIKKA